MTEMVDTPTCTVPTPTRTTCTPEPASSASSAPPLPRTVSEALAVGYPVANLLQRLKKQHVASLMESMVEDMALKDMTRARFDFFEESDFVFIDECEFDSYVDLMREWLAPQGLDCYVEYGTKASSGGSGASRERLSWRRHGYDVDLDDLTLVLYCVDPPADTSS